MKFVMAGGVAQRGELRHVRGKLRNARGKLRNARGSLHEFSDSTPAPKNHEDSAPAGGAPRELHVFFEKAHSFETPPGPLQWNVDSEEEPMKDTDPSPDEARAEFANVNRATLEG